MISARQLVNDVSAYLVDQDPDAPFTHWSEQDLLTYFRLAVEIVASTQKDRFTKRTTMRLVPGTAQEVPTACHDMVDVLGQIGDSGTIDVFPRRTSTAGLHALGSVGCSGCRGTKTGRYKLDSWQYSEANPNILYVYPPVPEGETVEIELTCFIPPTVDTLDSEVDLGLHMRPIIFHFMLHYGYGVDAESVPSRDRSTAHWNQAMQLLGNDSSALRNRYTATQLPELRPGARK